MSSSSTLPPGTRIAGKYELEGVLGRGGMGAVYLATHVGIGRRVAVKVLHASLLDREDVRKRFELEARAASVIEHPGLVDVFDLGETDDGDPFIVMEYLEGASLRTLSKQPEGLAPGQVVGVLLPVLDALGAAHAAGIVHRDVKPANVFVASRPQAVKLLDFGVSRFGRGGVTQVGDTVGTPRYMAPEQVLGLPDLGPEADLYSVGAVLFTLLAGRPPHQGTSDAAVLARVVNDVAPPLASVTQGLPAGLCAVVDELLVKAPTRRPKDAAAVRARLSTLGLDVGLKPVFARAAKHALDAGVTPTPSSSQPRVQAAVARSRSGDAVQRARGPAEDGALTPTPSSSHPRAEAAVARSRSGDAVQRARASSDEDATRTLPGAAPPPEEAGDADEAPRTGPGPWAVGGAARSRTSPPGDATRVDRPRPAPPRWPRVVGAALVLLAAAGLGAWWRVASGPAPDVQPPAPPPLPVGPPVAAAPRPVEVTLEAEPRDARFTVDGASLDCNPCRLEGAPGATRAVTVSADGAVSQSLDVRFDAPHLERVVLTLLPAGPLRASPKPKPAATGKKPFVVDEKNPYE